MEVEMTSSGELLELTIAGVLDNESATEFRDVVDGAVRDGWHRILVRLGAVTYLSSAGVGALLTAKKRLTGLKGFFGICELLPDVERVLAQTRVLDGLLCDPDVVLADVPNGTMTRLSKMRVASEDGVDLQIFRLETERSSASQPAMSCRLIGDVPSPGDVAVAADACQSVAFPETSLGLGLGALGDDVASCRDRFGEFLAVAGAVAQSPVSSGQLPDYSVQLGDFVPQVQAAYGVRCDGAFSHLIRFSSSEEGASLPVPLSKVVRLALQTIDCQAAAVVVLGECAGLVGTQLRRSPVTVAVGAGEAASTDEITGRFDFPQIRDWLSFSAEQIHRQSLALACGIVAAASSDQAGALEPFLRPFDADGTLVGHVHAAVFPYQPLKKRTLDLTTSVQELFNAGGILDVLHLLRDDRPINGAGESEFLSGACWIAPLTDVLPQGDAP